MKHIIQIKHPRTGQTMYGRKVDTADGHIYMALSDSMTVFVDEANAAAALAHFQNEYRSDKYESGECPSVDRVAIAPFKSAEIDRTIADIPRVTSSPEEQLKKIFG